jgi:putative PIN family toxin of toxin-antitoxin system
VLIALDTNVLASGLLNPFGPPGRVVDQLVSANLQVAYDDRILIEYADVLLRPRFEFTPEQVQLLIDHIALLGVQVAAEPLDPDQLPDRGDLPFAEVAVEALVDFLVSGNVSHFGFLAVFGVNVVSPSDFIGATERLAGF